VANVSATATLQDIFLLHRSGLLLKHYTRRVRPTMDSDVMSGMLVAVQEFIKDSLGKGLREIRLVGGGGIKVLEGKWTIIAAVVDGDSGTEHTAQMQAALKDLEARYEDLLIDWDGTMDQIPEVDRIMRRLIDGGYEQAAMAQVTT
jgi:OOP family OmpA-OmpF porin